MIKRVLINNKIGQGEIKKVVLHRSRVEIQMVDGEELNFYAKDAIDPKDELSVFATKMRNKFLDGRDKYQAMGSKGYKADTITELQKELLDQAAYGAVLFFDLERLKSELKKSGS